MNKFSLAGKTAVVTGGSAGIGFAIVKELAEAGASVAIVDISASGAEKAKLLNSSGNRVMFVQTDIRSPLETERAMEKTAAQFGGIDILVNNAGIYPRGMLEETTVDLWDQVMELNLKAMFLCCKAAVPHIRKRGGGAIVNLTSSHGVVGLPELFAYSVSKGGVNTLTRNLAGALSPDRIRVNAVNPGWVATEKEIAERENKGQSLEWLIETGKKLPLGRMQTGEDTSAAVLFLASDAASQLTGQILNVDGGKDVAMAFDDRSHDAQDPQ